MKVVYNNCYGGFSLSSKAQTRYTELSGKSCPDRDVERDDPILIQVIKELGKDANGSFAALKIIDVLPGSRWRIDEYDGQESVMCIEDYEWKTAI
jgi:hypothetical protein